MLAYVKIQTLSRQSLVKVECLASSKPFGVKFCPTGGVNLDNMNDWLSMDVVSAIGRSWLATKQQIADKQWSVITQQVKDALAKAAELN